MVISKDPTKISAKEAAEKFNYGERFGKNIIDKDYKRQEDSIKLFHKNI